MKLRIVSTVAGLACCLSTQAAFYYVNDASTNGDVYCSAAGHATNSGASASAPKPALADIVSAYTLGPGDTVFVDSGSYSNTLQATIGPSDSGSSTLGKVTIQGAGSAKTLLVTTNNGAYGVFFSGASHVRLEGVAIRSAGQGVRVENSDHIELVGCELFANTYGVVLSGGAGHRVEGCVIHHNGRQGVVGYDSASPVISGNIIYSQTGYASENHGIDLSYNCNAAQITGNTITNNAGRGVTIYSCAAPVLQNNVITGHGAEAVHMQSCSSASLQNQTVSLNANGVRLYYCPSATLTGSRIFSHTGYGVSVEGNAISALNNLIYANGGPGFTLLNAASSTIENNTFYRNATVNLRLAGSHGNVRVANNIFSSSGTAQTCLHFDTLGTSWFADYNDYFITNGAVMWNWKGPRYSLAALQTYSGNERHSIDRDPVFVDVDGVDNVLGGAGGADDNFHLAANSPALDAGDPSSSFAAEPAPNGSRINLGHWGGTAQADTSGNQRVLRLLAPNGGEIAFRRIPVRWAATGPWATNDMVKIEYSANNGGSWTTAANAASLNSANGFYGWDLAALTPGTTYLIRVSAVDQPTITDSSDASFEVQGPGAKVIYLNDTNTASDTWCTAPGAATNGGFSTASPLDSFQSVIEKYPAIGAGDEIRVDTGVFDLGRTVYLNQQNSGAPGSPLVFRGSTSGVAVFNRLDQSEDAALFEGVSWITFDRVNFTRGAAGLRVAGAGVNTSVGIVIKDCQSYSNSSIGFVVSTCTNLLVSGCSSWRNSSDGYSLSAVGATVTNNFAGWNSGGGLGFGGNALVAWNVCASNNNWGLSASRSDAPLLVSSNQTFRNGGNGLYMSGGQWSGDAQAIGNVSYNNGGTGLVGERCYGLIGNTIVSNSGDGLYSAYATHMTRNVVSDNRGHGITGWFGFIATNNLVVRNGANGNYWNINLSRDSVCRNNTIVGSNGVYVADTGITVVNNIIWTRGADRVGIYVANPGGGVTSDYNDIHATDGALVGNWLGPRASLASWQQVSLRDANSISIDPRFVDTATNFHLRSASGSYRGAPFTAPGGGSFVNDADVSFCIDAGDPAAGYAQEPAPNGGRIDLGAFGNNPDASGSPAARFSLLVEPLPGAKWFGTRTITWLTRGPWVGGDLVKLEFSADGGANWTNIAASVDYALGRYDWNTAGLPSGTNYLVRISKTDGTAMNTLAAAFEVSGSGPRTYYVNDTNTLNDVFCSAPGSAGNDGLSATTPKDSIQAILDTYKVAGGDTIAVDTGNYLLAATIVMTTNDVGEAGNPILIQGSANGTTINRQNTGLDAFYLQGAEYVRFQNLKFTGARHGLAGAGTSAQYLRGIEIVGCEAMSNNQDGLNFNYTSNLLVSACWLHHNGWRGAGLGACVQVTISSNAVAYNNYQYGIWAESSGVVAGNLIYSNNTDGLGLSGTFVVSGNTSWRNQIGIRGWTAMTMTNNLVFSNNYEGIYLNAGNQHFVEGNRVFGNSRTGIYFEGSGKARRNVVYSNGDHGIQIEGYEGDYREVVNNLCYLNGNAPGEFNIIGGANYWQAKRGLIENNTCYGGSGIYIGNPIAFTNRNNIVWASGANHVALVRYTHMDRYPNGYMESDNNLIYLTDGAIAGQWNGNQAELADWQYAIKQDYHSFDANPQFVNPAGPDGIIGGANGWDDNFHLASAAGSYAGTPFTATAISTFTTNATTSPAIDAATVGSLIGDELAPNGSRRNLGAFGGTADASLSPAAPGISILNLAANDSIRGVKRLYWMTRGPWSAGETLRLEYSSNGGSSWATAAGLGGVVFNQGSLDWDTSSLTSGANYAVRLVGNTNSAVSAVSPVTVFANGPADFYVNDASTANDAYCSAAGSESNSGLAPSAPKATLKRLFRDYKLLAGDRVWIDTGYWLMDSTLQFFDSGNIAAKIRFIGSPHAAGTWFDRGDNQQNAFLLSGVDNLSLENLKVRNSYDAIHIEGSGSDLCEGIQVLGCELATNYHFALYFTSATNLHIAHCDIHDNTYNGIYGVGHGVIRSNRVYRTDYSEAIRVWGGPLLVEGNQVHNNDSTGIAGTTRVTVSGNLVFSNDATGIAIDGADANLSEAIDNRVFLNVGDGISAGSGANARRNVVYSNKGHGIVVSGYEGNYHVIANNLCYANGDAADEYNIFLARNYWQAMQALVENNTCYGGSGIYVGNPINVTNRNNIIWATGSGRHALVRSTDMERYPGGLFVSDNNCILATGGATLGQWLGEQNDLLEWRMATGQDMHSFSVDPLFVNAAGTDGLLGGTNGLDDNFHLASTAGSYKGLAFTALTTVGFTADGSHSPCIDAGIPTLPVGGELAPNGGRLDLGAFGGTTDASLSTSDRGVELGLVGNGSVLRGTVPVSWWTHGPWVGGDTVLLEYSSNGGASWTMIPGAGALPFAEGVFAWDTSALTPGSNYKVRATPTAGGASSVSGVLRVLGNTATTFYLNDNSTTNDVYCAAVGSDANDGLTPATPMGTLKRLVATYRLMPGDTVRIDTGVWTLDANLILTDSGAPGQLIRFIGSTNSLGSVFNRNDTSREGIYAITLKTNHYVRLENLKVTGGWHGLVASGSETVHSQGIEIIGCEAYGNSNWGIIGVYCTNLLISGCNSHDNRHGIDADTGGGLLVGNSAHHNSDYGFYMVGRFTADGNDCHHNGGIGLRGENGVRAINNLVHENGGEHALRLSGVGCEAEGNRAYLNTYHGIYAAIGGPVRRNVSYSNGRAGIVADSWNGANMVVNNLCYDNDRRGEGYGNIYSNRGSDIIQNNTLYGTHGIVWEGPWSSTMRNNVIWARGAGKYAIYFSRTDGTPFSSFNNLYVTDGAQVGYWGGARADLAAWRSASGLDTNSISAHPQFVDIDGADDSLGGFYGMDDDFHLSSTAGSYHNGFWFADATNSPSIDAGDPSFVFTNEPYFNGLRVNQGAYGNTAEASKTAYSGTFYTLNIAINPAGGGTVAAWPPGVSNLYYPANTFVTLTASNNLGYIWNSFSGAVASTSNTVSLVVASNTAITANFQAVMPHVLYRFEDNLRSSIDNPPDLTNAGSGLSFSTATVRGGARRVYNFPAGTGVQLSPTLGVFPNQLYTMVMLVRLDNVSGWRRLIDFRNGIDQGFYVRDGKLEFHPYSGQSAVCVTNNTWHMIALTHDAGGQMKLYCDGVLRLTLNDSSSYGVVSSANTVKFFKDDGGDSGSGSVSRIHIFSRVLDLGEITALNALDDSSPLITSAALTGAAQGVPFLWPVTGPSSTAGFLASNLPPGLGIDPVSGQITGSASAPGVFDALVTATNSYGTNTQALRILVTSSTNLLFREDFNNGLSANWNALSADTNYYTFLPAMMDLRANNGETWAGNNRTLNLFAYSNLYAGDMVITLGVTRYEPTTANYNRLCVAAFDDYDNNVRFAYGYGDGRHVEISAEQGQSPAQNGLSVNLGSTPFLLRLVKQGGGASDSYTAYYSTNGVDFVGFANNTKFNGDGSPNLLGFWFGIDPNQSARAYIDYFEVTALPQTPVQTYADDFTPGNGAASWKIQNTAGLYTIDQSQGALAMSKASGGAGGGAEWAAAYSAVTLNGDFDVSVDYRDAVLTRLGGGWGNQIQLNCSMSGQFAAAIRGNEGGLGGDNAHVWFDPPAGNYGTVATTTTNGTLRIIRSGTLIKVYHNNTFLAQRTGNTNPASIYLSLQNNGTADPISVKFDNFRVSAPQVTLAAPVFTTPALTGGLSNSPFVWQVNADYWTGLSAAGLPPGLAMNTNGLITGTPTAAGAFDATITATNAQASAIQTLRIVINDGAQVMFREDFNNGLAAPWTTVASDTNYYSFQTGLMKLRANYGDTWTSYNRALNLFAVNTPTAGDFMLTLGIARFTPSLRDSPGIFLVAWDDTDNSVRYGYNGNYSGRGTSMSIESRGAMTSSVGANLDRGTNAFLMRLVKQGNMYSVWASTNGTDYAAITNIPAAAYANFTPRQLGFWMGLDSTLSDTMLIDYCEISAVTMNTASLPPVFASANLTGGLQGSPFLWEVSANHAAGFSAAGLPPGLSIAPQNGRITGTPTTAGVYDSTITATNAFGATNQTLRIVVRNPASVVFRDDFNDGFSSNWTATPTNYVTALPGMERVRANNGDVVGTLPVPFVTSVPTNTPFTLTLGLTRFVPGAWSSPSIWLMAWQDFDHLVRFGPYGNANGPRAQFGIETSAGAYSAAADYATNFGSGPFLIRLSASNNVFTSAYSTNGVDFIGLPGTNTAAFTPTNVGFWMGIDSSQSQIALVDYFEVSTPPPADPIAAWLAGYGLAGNNANYHADPDNDRSPNIFEYGFNMNPTNAASVFFPAGSVDNDHLVLTYRQRTGGAGVVGVDYTAGGLTYVVQVADNVTGPWQSGSSFVELIGPRVANGDGTETVRVQLKQTVPAASRKFIRLVLIPTP